MKKSMTKENLIGKALTAATVLFLTLGILNLTVTPVNAQPTELGEMSVCVFEENK